MEISWAQPAQTANAPKQPVPMLQSSQPFNQLQKALWEPPQKAVVSGSNAGGATAVYNSQPVVSQNYNQQPMQPVQQPSPNNWTENPNCNAYQQHNTVSSTPSQPTQHNNWPQQDLNPLAVPPPPSSLLSTSGYFLNQENFFQPQQQQQHPSMQQAYPPMQEYQENIKPIVGAQLPTPATDVISYSRQNTQQMDNTQEVPGHLDNASNNNTDGWGDWDWNDNGVQQQQQPRPAASFTTGTLLNNSSAIDDSFRVEANDNWQWGPIEENNPKQKNMKYDDLHQNSQQPPPQEEVEKIVSPPAKFKSTNVGVQQNTTIMHPALPGPQFQAVDPSAIAIKPTNLSPNDLAQSQENAQNNNNIPSSVYVSQAKPVSKPPRQYASLPGVTNDTANIIVPTTPPHAFQNRAEFQPPSVPLSTEPPTVTPPSMKTYGHPSAPDNPFKRIGSTQHHRAGIIPTPLNSQQPNVVISPIQYYASPPPPPEDFANPSVENHEVIAPDNSEVLHENQEIAPNNDRNEYLQTSHLSEIGGHADATYNHAQQEQSSEYDDFPPPGLSRLVLGQPENESRQVPGTEIENSLSIERQADGEDTVPSSQRFAFSASTDSQSNVSPNQMDITSDRNLYLVPGESDVHEQRVVTGLENGASVIVLSPSIQVEQRELELDGENIEDQQQPLPSLQTTQHQHSHHHLHRSVSPVSRDEPLEGGNSLDRQVQGSQQTIHETESSMTVETNAKDLSNISTGNEDSDPRGRVYGKSRRGGDESKRRPGNESKDTIRYESEESDFSSDRDRRRYREGSVRSDRERDQDGKERKRRDKREREVVGDRERYVEADRENRYRDKYYRDRESKQGRYASGRYDAESKYEAESSARHERRRGGDRDREAYEEYRRYRKYNARDERDIQERRGGGRSDGDRRRNDRDRDDRDPRRRKDHRERQRNDFEEYRKTSSRNARESDIEKESRLREKDPRYAAHNMYSGYPGYGYDPYAAYYYEQMVRTNPQAYSEWYKKYYGQSQPSESIINDGRESVHSGRSSANNEKERPDNLSLNLVDGTNSSIQQDPQRLTPYKYTNDHPIISLGPGLMVAVKSKYSHSGITNVVKIYKMGSNDATNKLFQSFPGPLVRGLTHKKTIIEFCEDQIRLGPSTAMDCSKQNSINSLSAPSESNKASFTLMWNLLILLLRQNGVVVGTDIAELLLKNQQQFLYETSKSSVASISNRRESLQSDEHRKSKEDSSSDAEQVIDDLVTDDLEESEDNIKMSSFTEEEVTNKFRNYLLYGNVNEALDWATDNNLWGHALFLASKMDRRSHANVMMKFANKLSLNDPLQTLYQLMSGRTPSSVISVQDEKWGDWRPHLAMILSNASQKPELDRKAITTIGDSLFNRGDLFAAHFCYLMAQVGFNKYPEKQSDTIMMQNSIRLVLLGSSHHKAFEEFATNESIMMTEVYEYACSLNDEKFTLPEFQPYKFLLATRMLDYGYQLKCLMYMEQICLHIQRDPTKYEPSFIQQVYELADRLKYYDPVLEKSMDEMQMDVNHSSEMPFEEQKWLQELRILAAEYMVKKPQEFNQDFQQTPNVIDQQFSEINKQFNELNLQYNTNSPLQEPQAESAEVQYNSQFNSGSQVSPTNVQQYQQFYNPNEPIQKQTVREDEVSYDNGYVQPQEAYQQPQHVFETQHQTVYEQQQVQTYSGSGEQQQQNSYEYWDNQAQNQGNETARPMISMPNSQPQKSGFNENSVTDDLANKAGQQRSSAAGMKTDSKNQFKGGQSSNQNSGWFGGIWNKLSMKPKNQMILPDDKNPAIVWDSDKKKWVNTDGDEEGEESVKPPPKMSDLMPTSQRNLLEPQQQQYQQSQQLKETTQQLQLQPPQPILSAGPTQTPASTDQIVREPQKQPSLQSNMFKMQRNRTLKNSYVDVFNPSGAAPKATEQVLAPALPPAAVPVGGFFVPGAASDSAYQQQQEGVPHFYNPNQFSGCQ